MIENSPSRPNTHPAYLRYILLLLLAGGGLLIAAGLYLALRDAQPSSQFPAVGEPLADFSLPGLDGQPVRLSDYAGRPVLLNFWASWCPPCREETPYLNAFYQQHQSEGFIILAVNAGESRDVAASAAEYWGMEFPVLVDKSYTLTDRLMITSYPTSILIGRDGRVKAIHAGGFSSDQLEAELAPHLK